MNPPLTFPSRWLIKAMILGCLMMLGFQPVRAEKTGEARSGPLLRIVCVSSLTENQELVLASRDDQGGWHEHAPVKLRASFITEWLPAATGKLHLAERGAEGLVSKCSFTYPEGARRAIAVLLPDVAKQQYRADVIDPAKLSFAKGSTLVVNYSPKPGVVMLGTRRADAKPGARLVVKPAAGPDGMFRMLAGYQNEARELVPCYDRYVPINTESRDFLMLFPDPVVGLRVYSLAEFGPFE